MAGTSRLPCFLTGEGKSRPKRTSWRRNTLVSPETLGMSGARFYLDEDDEHNQRYEHVKYPTVLCTRVEDYVSTAFKGRENETRPVICVLS